MAWNYFAAGSNKKDQEDRKRKLCCCGGHNLNNAKRNKKHNATRSKLEIRKARQEKEKLFNILIEEE